MTAKHDPLVFARNMAKVAQQSQQIIQDFMTRQAKEAALDGGASGLHLNHTFYEIMSSFMAQPDKLWQRQVALWQDYTKLWHYSAQRLIGEESQPVIEPDARDRRFKDAAWQENTLFDFIKQSYLLAARWLQDTAKDSYAPSPHIARKVDFYTRQFVDAMAPSNFLMTNPEVLKATLASDGDNLVKGLRNLLEDMERGQGKLKISLTDNNAFSVGKNLATTKGKVVYQNDLMQLIQYEPQTDMVHKTPLLIIPAWINKYYILDMQKENSMILWLLEQGYTVFIISWVNPDEKLSRKRFDDYLIEGPIAALDAIEAATGEKQIGTIGYCLGGTLLSITLAYLKAKKQESRIKSATYLTTMVDFSEAGELSVFIDEEQLRLLEGKMSERGYLEGSDMAMTFNMLRANDLIWSFVVNNYLLGKEPFPFDLLYWNSDSTRMPATMHSFYLRNMYQKNLLVKPKGITLAGTPIDLNKIDTPTYILSTKDDHIAPWKSTYAATQLYSGPVRFVLAGSGHIAGVVNPPAKNKYGYWAGNSLPASPDAWLEKAKENAGSWWPDWEKWHANLAGPMVKARKPGGSKLKVIEDAPGAYVRQAA